ncbi:hypothetical protein SELMODRAFT_438494 [Selaginella moellendorffii]|uniref:BTB domain-containing protein n=1 Tax=Selaginella moellendorffii TaxID=88036 RepID=D8QYH5_SELML|nr:BTB/POZ domain-containing protein At1g55760 [Selaginella moellendorffii]XP_002974619.1 BTB/POZ domain-containing protein At1g55760 [Selaginella moellendorffii]XP_024524345.1 BTB/POZ domain-containing protein At1g55760 [Selaginella moellendorffii]XP_024535472.1 BTB/POZ domain-containing protein At1g55760 [Selaginella moellendorffii]EFJ24139.1 hypothetical protein SELMODRAFT_442577 [Selaginella moellendorffii]EFJ35200.1 hypothetical protein SELMODRAFT_438494 [Selaginella moellendorffii]|eukprot:XP_002963329.1 BTB/POZ domain-containing protein At1g55760 [Selaginella moellendorffii]
MDLADGLGGEVIPCAADEEVSVCYQCGQLCENNFTYCHSCFEQRSQSDFRNEQRWRNTESSLQSAELVLQRERANIRRLEATVSAFRAMLLQAIHPDVTIETGDGDTTPAHRAVLASRSPVFNAMFEHELKEKTCAVIRVADVPTPAMRALLLYLYTGEHDTKVMKDHGMALLAAAHKYDIPDLKKICETAVSVHASNALEVLQNARLYDANHLKRVCIECIARNIKQLAFADEFRQLVFKNEDPEAVLDIIQTLAHSC